MTFALLGADLGLARHSPAALAPRPGSGVMLAEAVTFDPGIVVAFFMVLLVIGLTWLGTLVMGVACGRRFGRDRADRRAAIVWWCCTTVQVTGAAVALRIMVGTGPSVALLPLVLSPCATLAAFGSARRQRLHR